MTEQQPLFDGPFLRDTGIAAAERDRALIIREVDLCIGISADNNDGFTAEDVRNYLGPYVRDLEDVSKVIGGRMRAAAVAGRIYTKGETITASRPDAHSRRMLVWYGKRHILEVVA